jgi:hypothetical protein
MDVRGGCARGRDTWTLPGKIGMRAIHVPVSSKRRTILAPGKGEFFGLIST